MHHRTLIRIFDVAFSIFLIILGFIPLSLAILIKLLVDGRPLFYNSHRIGRNGEKILVYKFRTMINNRQKIEDYLEGINSYGFEKIPLDSPIYTPMGRFFEKFQIVEVVQLINVLEGNMSIIGYRPLPQYRVIQLEQEFGRSLLKNRHNVLPGITGLSQVVGKSILSNKERLEIEIYYNEFIKESSSLSVIKYNLLIIIETLSKIFFKRSAINLFNKKIMLKQLDAEQLSIKVEHKNVKRKKSNIQLESIN